MPPKLKVQVNLPAENAVAPSSPLSPLPAPENNKKAKSLRKKSLQAQHKLEKQATIFQQGLPTLLEHTKNSIITARAELVIAAQCRSSAHKATSLRLQAFHSKLEALKLESLYGAATLKDEVHALIDAFKEEIGSQTDRVEEQGENVALPDSSIEIKPTLEATRSHPMHEVNTSGQMNGRRTRAVVDLQQDGFNGMDGDDPMDLEAEGHAKNAYFESEDELEDLACIKVYQDKQDMVKKGNHSTLANPDPCLFLGSIPGATREPSIPISPEATASPVSLRPPLGVSLSREEPVVPPLLPAANLTASSIPPKICYEVMPLPKKWCPITSRTSSLLPVQHDHSTTLCASSLEPSFLPSSATIGPKINISDVLPSLQWPGFPGEGEMQLATKEEAKDLMLGPESLDNSIIAFFAKRKINLDAKTWFGRIVELRPDAAQMNYKLLVTLLMSSSGNILCRYHFFLHKGKAGSKPPATYTGYKITGLSGLRRMKEESSKKKINERINDWVPGFMSCGCEEFPALLEYILWKEGTVQTTLWSENEAAEMEEKRCTGTLTTMTGSWLVWYKLYMDTLGLSFMDLFIHNDKGLLGPILQSLLVPRSLLLYYSARTAVSPNWGDPA
ncbi:hypothetical protein C8J56DRAFT_1171603 [Mycena floridula]|nr:hypothetical protein C8J56DRAFT_1171603 [Mycena floridula]